MHIGVVIPLFKQAQYLIECVTSALTQTLVPKGVVIVNDGCPDSSSDTLSRAIAGAWPEQTLYVRQENRGLSSARNTGVRVLLNHWPEVEAILPLDADNWLEERCLETMAARLSCEDRPDWVYPDKQCFGTEFTNWKAWPWLNPFRLLFENQCDAASLIRRTVFDAGLFYDEAMREGYEDWEFFIRAARHGFRGASGGQVGFYYRMKKNSMRSGAEQKWAHIVNSIHKRHSSLMRPWNLTACEHKHLPRFRFIDEQKNVSDFSDPLVPPAWDQASDLEYVPPITIVGSRAAFEDMNRDGILRGLLFSIQHSLLKHPWSIDLQHREAGIRFERHGHNQTPVLFISQTKMIADQASSGSIQSLIHKSEGMTISSPEYSLTPRMTITDLDSLLHQVCAIAGRKYEPKTDTLEKLQESSSLFALQHNLSSFEATYPLACKHGIDICFTLPFFRLGGIERCVLKIAEGLKRVMTNARLHLLITHSGVVDFDPAQLSVFDEIVSIAHCDHEARLEELNGEIASKIDCEQDERLQLLSGILRSMDVVINADSLEAYQALPLLPQRSQAVHRPVCISYLHVMEDARNEKLLGYPYVAAIYEAEIDLFLVTSGQLQDFLINSGVNEERIRIGPKAPTVRLPTREQALLLADHKAERQICSNCFTLLFAGRLDYQNEIAHLVDFILLADQEGVNLRVTVLGSETLDAEKVDWASSRVQFIQQSNDVAKLARHFEEADGVILLSRWEGVPLVLLDAMAHGCVVFASDVGTINELIIDGRNGFLCPSSDGDETGARAAVERIKLVLADPTGCRQVRRRAAETAMDFTWDQVVAALDGFLHPP